MGNAIFNREMFVYGSLQIVVARHIGPQRQSVRANQIMRRNLWPAAAIVELEGRVEVTTRAVGVNFAALGFPVTDNEVAKRLGRGSVFRTDERGSKKRT